MAHATTDLSPDATAEIAAGLNQAVAETVVTTMLAQNFHWNVTGMAFGPLHALFQEIYEDHFVGQDDLAERIRAIGHIADGKLATHLARSKVEEGDEQASDRDMIRHLAEAQETISATLAGLGEVAARHGDVRTEDLAIARGQIHDKFAWMLRAHIR
ncbi:Dps family protein [Jannaschia seohaensis]|uniref:Starvation-inducible DNA-binding protein n=1 Tax=Jannaschia seohaensis TaxID=475081 RepID=A0A2Y9A299_9RHOB|nr:DNA starvation/stationary phase protection protein [Jannaschia seohaensis]PWJ22393.1 starvation-inducible DNA-binding protein [Jannaschia seohaensis]SSA38671.1 starvation-inducible DNA-binding protein [Jannaschia seohaensis]